MDPETFPPSPLLVTTETPSKRASKTIESYYHRDSYKKYDVVPKRTVLIGCVLFTLLGLAPFTLINAIASEVKIHESLNSCLV